MTNEQKQVKDWMRAFGQEAPEKPTIPSLEVRKLRARLILEEALETIEALGFKRPFEKVAENYFTQAPYIEPNLEKIADGCEDLKVVTEGTLVACGLTTHVPYSIKQNGAGIDPLFDEVMRSNWSKMWTQKEITIFDINNLHENPMVVCDADVYHSGWTITKIVENKYLVKDTNGKIIKSPSYSPPNLQPIINEMFK